MQPHGDGNRFESAELGIRGGMDTYVYISIVYMTNNIVILNTYGLSCCVNTFALYICVRM